MLLGAIIWLSILAVSQFFNILLVLAAEQDRTTALRAFLHACWCTLNVVLAVGLSQLL